MAGDGVGSIRATNGIDAQLKIAGDFGADEIPPVEVITVRKDGAAAWRFHLLPTFEVAIPRGIQRREGAIALFEPLAKAGLRVGAEAEFRIGEVRELGPVNNVRLAPHIPAVQRGRV